MLKKIAAPEYNVDMNKKNITLAYRSITVLLVLAAVITQLTNSVSSNPSFSLTNFFSFFTIESNIFIAVVFGLLVSSHFTENVVKHGDFLRGAAIFYMITTGVIYTLLLRNVNVQVPLPWVNSVLHYIVPLIAIFDWIYNPPRPALRFERALYWLIFPLIYFIYSLIRGIFTDWYPYPFMNAKLHSYSEIAISSIVIAVGLIALVKILSFSIKNLDTTNS